MTEETGCGRCHECGFDLFVDDSNEPYCPVCGEVRCYVRHGWPARSVRADFSECFTLSELDMRYQRAKTSRDKQLVARVSKMLRLAADGKSVKAAVALRNRYEHVPFAQKIWRASVSRSRVDVLLDQLDEWSVNVAALSEEELVELEARLKGMDACPRCKRYSLTLRRVSDAIGVHERLLNPIVTPPERLPSRPAIAYACDSCVDVMRVNREKYFHGLHLGYRGFVYLVRHHDTKLGEGVYKIGFTARNLVYERLDEQGYSQSDFARALATRYPRELESRLHQQFANKRVADRFGSRELFVLDPQDLVWIASLREFERWPVIQVTEWHSYIDSSGSVVHKDLKGPHDAISHGSARLGKARYGEARRGLARRGLARQGEGGR